MSLWWQLLLLALGAGDVHATSLAAEPSGAAGCSLLQRAQLKFTSVENFNAIDNDEERHDPEQKGVTDNKATRWGCLPVGKEGMPLFLHPSGGTGYVLHGQKKIFFR